MMEKTYLNPHIRTPKTTELIMKDVCLALVPAFIGAVYFFGVGAFFLTLACVATCVACEALWEKLNHLPVRMDYSAVVTGMLLAFNLSSNTPVWVAILASAFAIIVVKQCFGGIGSNFANPALMGRLFVMVVYPSKLMSYVAPGPDAVSSATVLTMAKHGEAVTYSVFDMFLGRIPGALGETSALLLLLGFVFLAVRKDLDWIITVVYLAVTVAVTSIAGMNPLVSLFGGGLILGGCYMLTDYTLSSSRAKVLFGIIAGLLTALIRIFSPTYPEGVCFAILTVNILSYFIELFIKPHIYGVAPKKKTEE